MDYKIEWVGCAPENYEVGGAVDQTTGIKHVPIAIVNHIMAGSLNGTIQWFNNPAAQASTNYGIGKNGRIVQFVKDGVDRPYANGRYCNATWNKFIKRKDGSIVNPNRYTISIEHEGQPGDTVTEEMYQASLWLQKKLIKEWNLPVNRDTIIGHYQIDACDRPNCPGPNFPFERLMSDLLAWNSEPTEKYPEGTIAEVNVDGLNIRRTPDGEKIDTIRKGLKYPAVESTKEWVKINTDGYGMVWAWKEYLKIIPPVKAEPAKPEPPQPAPQPPKPPTLKILEEWQYDVGVEAVKYLNSNNLLHETETWTTEDKLAASVPTWLFFEMLRRVRESK